MNLVSLLILLIVLVCICIVAKWFVTYMEIPNPINWIVLLVVGLVCLLLLLNALGLGMGPVIKIQ